MRLIDADWLLKLVCGRRCGCNPDGCGCEDYHECEIGAYIKESPTVDAVEVVRGEWVQCKTSLGKIYSVCSNCKTDFKFKTDRGTFARLDMNGMPYCPNCGARMDGERRNDDA